MRERRPRAASLGTNAAREGGMQGGFGSEANPPCVCFSGERAQTGSCGSRRGHAGPAQTRTARCPGPFGVASRRLLSYAAKSAFIFFSAFASIWRMRSAETPYSSASSCRVTLLSGSSQRRLTMSRERASRRAKPSRSRSS